MNVKVGSVLHHRCATHPGLIVVTLEDSPGEYKMTRILILASDYMGFTPETVSQWKLTPEDWKMFR